MYPQNQVTNLINIWFYFGLYGLKTQNIDFSYEINSKSGETFWVLDFGLGLQIFFVLFIFFRSLVSKKSSGVQNSQIWAVFHYKEFSQGDHAI